MIPVQYRDTELTHLVVVKDYAAREGFLVYYDFKQVIEDDVDYTNAASSIHFKVNGVIEKTVRQYKTLEDAIADIKKISWIHKQDDDELGLLIIVSE